MGFALLKGKKTFAAGVALILYGAAGVLLGHVELNDGIRMVLEGSGFVGLRIGINSSLKQMLGK